MGGWEGATPHASQSVSKPSFLGGKLTAIFPACHPSRKLSIARQKQYLYASPTHLFSEISNVSMYTSPLVFENNHDSQVKFFEDQLSKHY